MPYTRRGMSADQKHILSPFGGHKKRRLPNQKQRTAMTKENRQNLANTDRGSFYNQGAWLEEFLEDKAIFYNNSNSDSETYDNESSSDDDDEQKEVCKSFNMNSLKIVSALLLQVVINNFAVCKHCGGKHLLCKDIASSHSFGRMWKFECETGSCDSNKLTYRPITPKRSYFL